MAFMSVILMFVFFVILMLGIACLFLCAVLGLTLCIVFTFLYRKEKKGGSLPPGGGWKKRAAIVSGVVGIFLSLILAAGFIQGTKPRIEMVEIETDNGTVEVQQSEAAAFCRAIEADDPQTVASMLEASPALIGYVTFEGYTPLGASIRYSSPAVTDYLLRYGVDVDDASGGDTTSVALVCRMAATGRERLNVEILNLLLDYHPDVNSKSSAMPPVQHVIRYGLEDSDISGEDMALLRRFLDEGADLSAPNGVDEDAMQYFEKAVKEYGFTEAQEEEVEEMRELLRGSF